MSDFNNSLRSSTINFGDDFDDLSEVVRLFMPAAEKILSRRQVHIPGRYGTLIWVVRDEDIHRIGYGPATDAKGWSEITSVVSRENAGRRPEKGERCVEKGVHSRRRLLFKKESRAGVDWLKFYGVFELDADFSSRLGELAFRRVATSASCAGGDVARQPCPAAAELTGRMLEAVLLDKVETLGDEAKTVRVWPGAILHVDRVDHSSGLLVCTAEGQSAPVAVPVRDVELGYFRLLPADGPSPRTRWVGEVKTVKRPPRTSRPKAKNFTQGFCSLPEVCGYPRGFAMGEHAEKYCIVDLCGGTTADAFPVTFTDKAPAGGWTEEHKTRKLVLRRVKADRPFLMGSNRLECSLEHRVRLGGDYYIGLFPVTQEQYRLVTGTSPSRFGGEADAATRPVESVSYRDVRGHLRGCEWPLTARVDGDCFMGILRAKTGIGNFDLPTAAQWEHACGRCGKAPDNGAFAWSERNARGETHPVGLLKPNARGLYDMRGNVWEWCLDWYEYKVRHEDNKGYGVVLEPAGVSSGRAREMRGGGWNVGPENCTPFDRGYSGPSHGYPFTGFRVCLALDAMRVRAERPEIVGLDFFPNVDAFTDIVVPEGIRRIEDGVFKEAKNLLRVTLPSTLEAIGAECFKDCTGLSEIFIPDSVKEIGKAAFEGCTALRTVRLSSGTETLPHHLFHGCAALERVEIPEGVKGCEGGVFTGCRALREVVLPEGVTTIGHCAFGQDNPIERIVLPRTVTALSPYFLNDAAGAVEVVCDWEGRDWESINGDSWAAILRYHPEFAVHCRKWGGIDAAGWVEILKRHPHLAGQCHRFEVMDARQWMQLPIEELDIPVNFDFAAMLGEWGGSSVERDGVEVIDRLIKIGVGDVGALGVWQWAALLARHPEHAAACPFEKFGVEVWANLLKVREEFADRCDWSSFDKDDWVRFLSICRNQYRRCPCLDAFTGTDWAEIGIHEEKADGLSAYHGQVLAGLCDRFCFIDRASPLFLEPEDAGTDALETYAKLVERCRARLASDAGVRQALEGTRGRNLVVIGEDGMLSACGQPGPDACYPDKWTGGNLLGAAWMALRDSAERRPDVDLSSLDPARDILKVTGPVRMNYEVRTQEVVGYAQGIFGFGRVQTETHFIRPDQNQMLVHPGVVFKFIRRNDDGTLHLMTDNRPVLRIAEAQANVPEEEYFDGVVDFTVPESVLEDGSLAIEAKADAVDVWDLPEAEYDPVNIGWDPDEWIE